MLTATPYEAKMIAQPFAHFGVKVLLGGDHVGPYVRLIFPVEYFWAAAQVEPFHNGVRVMVEIETPPLG